MFTSLACLFVMMPGHTAPNISVQLAPMRMADLAKKLEPLVGKKLMIPKSAISEQLVMISVTDVTAEALLEKVAKATFGTWKEVEVDTLQLLPNAKERAAALESYFADREKFEDVVFARKMKFKAAEERPEGLPPGINLEVEFALHSLAEEIIGALGPKYMARVTTDRRLAMSNIPNSSQAPLPQSVKKLLDEAVLKHHKKIDAGEGVPRSVIHSDRKPLVRLILPGSEKFEPLPARYVVTVTESTFGTYEVDYQLQDRAGKVLFPAEGRVDHHGSLKNRITGIPEEIVWRHPFRTSLFPDIPSAPKPVAPRSPDFRSEKMLAALVAKEGVDLVANLPSGLKYPEGLDDYLNQWPFAVVKEDGWAIVRPSDPDTADYERIDHVGLERLEARVAAGQFVSFDDLSEFARGSGYPDTFINGDWGDWDLIRALGHLSRKQQAALLAGEPFPMTEFPPAAERALLRFINQREPSDSDEFKHRFNQPFLVSAEEQEKVQIMLDSSSLPVEIARLTNSELTEIAPRGIRSVGEIVTRSEPDVLARAKPGGPIMSVDRYGSLLFEQGGKSTEQSIQFGVSNLYRGGLKLSEDVYYHFDLSIDMNQWGRLYGRLSEVPIDQRKRVEQSMDAARKYAELVKKTREEFEKRSTEFSTGRPAKKP